MKVNELQNSNFENLMKSLLDGVIKIAKMKKISYILYDVSALKFVTNLFVTKHILYTF